MGLMKKLAVLMALMGFAGAASAAESTTFIIWAYGSGPTILEALQGLSAFMSSSLFNSMFYFIVMTGFFGYGGAIALRMTNKWEMPFTYIILVFLFIVVFFQARIDISIEDPVNGFGGEQGIARDIPLGLALPAVVISEFGHSATQAIEFYLSDVKGFPRGGTLTSGNQFNFVATMMKDLKEVRIGAPEINASMRNYIEDCLMPAMYLGTKDYRTIMTSNNLWNAVQLNDQVRLTAYMPYGGNPNRAGSQNVETVSCASAWQSIKEDLDVYAPALVRNFGQSSWKYSEAAAALTEGAIGEIMYWAKGRNGGYVSGTEIVNTAAVMNTFDDKRTEVGSGVDTGLASQIAGEKARAAQEESWSIGAQNFNATAGYLLSVLQAFLYATTPLIILFAMIPGMGGKILLSFVQFLLALALWQPLLAIVNFLIASFVKTDIENTLMAGGMSLNTLPALSSSGAKMVGVGGYLGTMIPVLAWGLVKTGGLAVTNFLSEASAPSNSARAGEEAAAGNINMGNATLNNMQANRQSLAHTMSTAAGDVSGQSAGAVGYKVDGGGTQGVSVGGSSDGRREVNTNFDVSPKAGRFSDSSEAAQSLSKALSFLTANTSGTDSALTGSLSNGSKDTQTGGTSKTGSFTDAASTAANQGAQSTVNAGSGRSLTNSATPSVDALRAAGALAEGVAEVLNTPQGGGGANGGGGTGAPATGSIQAPGTPGATTATTPNQKPGKPENKAVSAMKTAGRAATRFASGLLKAGSFQLSTQAQQSLQASFAQAIQSGKAVTAQEVTAMAQAAMLSDTSSREQAQGTTATNSTKTADMSTRQQGIQDTTQAAQKSASETGGGYSDGYKLKQSMRQGMTLAEMRSMDAAQYGFNLDAGNGQALNLIKDYENARSKTQAEVDSRSIAPIADPKAQMANLDKEFASEDKKNAAKRKAADQEIQSGKAALDRPDGDGFAMGAAGIGAASSKVADDRVQTSLGSASVAARAAAGNADTIPMTEGTFAKMAGAATYGQALGDLNDIQKGYLSNGIVSLGEQSTAPVPVGDKGQTVELLGALRTGDGGALPFGVLKTPGQPDVAIVASTDKDGTHRFDAAKSGREYSPEVRETLQKYGSGRDLQRNMEEGARYARGDQNTDDLMGTVMSVGSEVRKIEKQREAEENAPPNPEYADWNDRFTKK